MRVIDATDGARFAIEARRQLARAHATLVEQLDADELAPFERLAPIGHGVTVGADALDNPPTIVDQRAHERIGRIFGIGHRGDYTARWRSAPSRLGFSTRTGRSVIR